MLKFGGAVGTIETSNNPDIHSNWTTSSFLALFQSLSIFVKIVKTLHFQTTVSREPQVAENRSRTHIKENREISISPPNFGTKLSSRDIKF